MPRKRGPTIFKHGKRGVTSADEAVHMRRWLAIETLRKRNNGMSVNGAASHLIKNPRSVPEVVIGGDADLTRPTFTTAATLRASHARVEKMLASEGIHPHKFRKLITGK